MARKRITIETANCKRCGKIVHTTSRALHGLDNLKAKYGIICQDCTSPEELAEINNAIGEALAHRYGYHQKSEGVNNEHGHNKTDGSSTGSPNSMS